MTTPMTSTSQKKRPIGGTAHVLRPRTSGHAMSERIAQAQRCSTNCRPKTVTLKKAPWEKNQ